jgi:signal transduction histidine kinase
MVGAVNNMAESLSQQDSLRRRLTTDVAHELRTPITVVASHLEAMMDGVWDATPERLKSLYDETARLSDLVSDLERLSKVENGIRELNKTEIDLLDAAKSAKSGFEIEADKKGIQLSVVGEPTTVLADKARIQQVLANLLSNALKYTPDGGRVNLAVYETDEGGAVSVEDNGIGISEEELPLVFERFYRTDKSRSRKTGGAGIGLAIVKSIVEAHGGKVAAKSAPDKGSVFIVNLPKEVK